MKKDVNRKQRRTVKVNGVKIVNAENVKKPQKNNGDGSFDGTENLIWLADKDNLEL